LDKIDKAILRELQYVSCRSSYRSIGKKIGLSPNGVKYRIEKLIETGVIIRFYVRPLTKEIMDMNNVLAFVITDGTEDTSEFIAKIGDIPMIYYVSPLICTEGGAYLCYAECFGNAMQVDLGVILRSMESVQKVELHTALNLAGGTTTDFSKLQLRVLRCLYDDPRMRISEIAKKTGIGTKTIRRVLREFGPRNAVFFGVRLNLSAGGLVDAWVRIFWDVKMTTVDELVHWLRDEFPDELWWFWVSTTDSIIIADFIVDNVEEIEQISRRIRKAPFVKSTSALAASTGYPFVRLSEIKTRKMLEKVDL